MVYVEAAAAGISGAIVALLFVFMLYTLCIAYHEQQISNCLNGYHLKHNEQMIECDLIKK